MNENEFMVSLQRAIIQNNEIEFRNLVQLFQRDDFTLDIPIEYILNRSSLSVKYLKILENDFGIENDLLVFFYLYRFFGADRGYNRNLMEIFEYLIEKHGVRYFIDNGKIHMLQSLLNNANNAHDDEFVDLLLRSSLDLETIEHPSNSVRQWLDFIRPYIIERNAPLKAHVDTVLQNQDQLKEYIPPELRHIVNEYVDFRFDLDDQTRLQKLIKLGFDLDPSLKGKKLKKYLKHLSLICKTAIDEKLL